MFPEPPAPGPRPLAPLAPGPRPPALPRCPHSPHPLHRPSPVVLIPRTPSIGCPPFLPQVGFGDWLKAQFDRCVHSPSLLKGRTVFVYL